MSRILIIGDSCIDRWVYGKCNRLSPDGPVPVFMHSEWSDMELSEGSSDGASAFLLGFDALWWSDMFGSWKIGSCYKKISLARSTRTFLSNEGWGDR